MPPHLRRSSGLAGGSAARPSCRRRNIGKRDLARRLALLARAGRVWLAASMLHRGDDRRRLTTAAGALARDMRVPLLAINDVLYHEPDRRELQDVLTCIREHVTLDAAGKLLEANARTPSEAARAKWRACSAMRPKQSRETVRFAGRIAFSLADLKYNYPDEPVPPGKTAQAISGGADLGRRGLALSRRHSRARCARRLEKELALIEKLDYRALFPHRARHRGLRRPARHSLPGAGLGRQFRGLLRARHHRRRSHADRPSVRAIHLAGAQEPPDIDVDFEHERREEVIQDIYRVTATSAPR